MTGRVRALAVALALLLWPAAACAGRLSVPLVVKEAAGTGATEFPVSVVVPLPSGGHAEATSLRVVDGAGRPVPAQVDVLNRWWGRDRSVRHVKLEFQPTVTAFKGAGTGTATYRLVDSGPATAPARAVSVRDEPGRVVIDTGAVTFTIERRPFRVVTPTGPLEAVLAARYGEQRSFDRPDVTVEIEEQGPMRAVVRAEAPTLYRGADDHVHGWALRVYAWAGKPFVRVDYQLQNSAATTVYAAPLYFRSLALTRPGGVAATMRWMSEMGGAVTRDAIHLVPPGGWVDGLYWLDDMRHVVFQTTYWFGGAANARLAQWPPVAIVPTAWYAATKATLDLGGTMPLAGPVRGADRRVPDPPDAAHTGWDSFWLDVERRTSPSQAGGWPYSASRFIATESPADVFHAERLALGELNGRPQWMAQYRHERDWPRLRLSTNPYAGKSWRRFVPSAAGLAAEKLDAPYLPGTARRSWPRNDAHAWFYHVEEAYYATADPWIRDWYRFVAEFRHVFLEGKDPYPERSSRGVGHALSHALAAHRVTGDPRILPAVRRYVLGPLQASLYATGGRASGHQDADTRKPPFENVFMTGYLARALVNYLEEVGADPEVEAVLTRLVEWNVRSGNFGYGVNPADPGAAGVSSGTAITMADPQTWLALRTGSAAMRQQVVQYIRSGVNGGQRPYVDLTTWSGDFVGRLTTTLNVTVAPASSPRAARAAQTPRTLTPAPRWHPEAARVLPDIPAGSWWAAPDTKLRAVVPHYALDGSGGWPPGAIVGTWNGGVLDTKRGIMLLPLGGGHADWFWNNVYGFHVSTLRWERMTEASQPVQSVTVPIMPDGQPAARHTYGGLQYVPVIDRVWIQGGALWRDGRADMLTWLFDVEHRRWTRVADTPMSTAGLVTAVDHATGRVIVHGGWQLFAYDIARDAYRPVSRREGHRGNGYSGVIVDRWFYMLGHGEVRRYALDASGPVTVEVVPTRGATEILTATAPGVDWDPDRKCIVAWSGGASIYLLDPVTATWTVEELPGTAPGRASRNGTYGRFRRLPSHGIYVLVNGVEEDVYFVRLTPPR